MQNKNLYCNGLFTFNKHLLSTYPFQVIFQQQHAQVHHIHRVMLDLDYVLFENNLENKTIFQPSIFVGFSISWKSLVNLSKETKFNKCLTKLRREGRICMCIHRGLKATLHEMERKSRDDVIM